MPLEQRIAINPKDMRIEEVGCPSAPFVLHRIKNMGLSDLHRRITCLGCTPGLEDNRPKLIYYSMLCAIEIEYEGNTSI
jgi:hypothetical protein